MSIEKTLHRIQHQIAAMRENMQNFADDTIQPSAADCDTLRRQMHELLDELSVYKFQKANAEISPSFNIHAKVSAKTAELEEVKASTPAPEIIPPAPPVAPKSEIPTPPAPQPVEAVPAKETVTEAPKQRAPLTVGINDKFRFINELFAQNSAEYNIVIEQLNTLQQWADTDLYLNSLKTVYGWKDSHETYKYFIGIVRRRFDA